MSSNTFLFKCTNCSHLIYFSHLVVHKKICSSSQDQIFFQIPSELLSKCLKKFEDLNTHFIILNSLISQNLDIPSSNLQRLHKKTQKLTQLQKKLSENSQFSLNQVLKLYQINKIKFKIDLINLKIFKPLKTFKQTLKFHNLLEKNQILSKYFYTVYADSKIYADIQYLYIFNEFMIIRSMGKITCFDIRTGISQFVLKVKAKFGLEVLGNMEFILFYENFYWVVWNVKMNRIEKEILLGNISSCNVQFTLNQTHAVFLNRQNKKNSEFVVFGLDLKTFELRQKSFCLQNNMNLYLAKDEMETFYFADKNIICFENNESMLVYSGQEKIGIMCFSNDGTKLFALYLTEVLIINTITKTYESTINMTILKTDDIYFLTTNRKYLILNADSKLDINKCIMKTEKTKKYLLKLNSKSVGCSKLSLNADSQHRSKNILKNLDDFNLKSINFFQVTKWFYIALIKDRIITINFENMHKKTVYFNLSPLYISIIANTNAYCLSSRFNLHFWRSSCSYPESSIKTNREISLSCNLKFSSTKNFIVISSSNNLCFVISFKQRQLDIRSTIYFQTIIKVKKDKIIYKTGNKFFKLDSNETLPELLFKCKDYKAVNQVFYVKKNIAALINDSHAILINLSTGCFIDKIELQSENSMNTKCIRTFNFLMITTLKKVIVYDLNKFCIVETINLDYTSHPYLFFRMGLFYIHYLTHSYKQNIGKTIDKCLWIYRRNNLIPEKQDHIETGYQKIGFLENEFYTISESLIKVYSACNQSESLSIDRPNSKHSVCFFNGLIILTQIEHIDIYYIGSDPGLKILSHTKISNSFKFLNPDKSNLFYLPEPNFLIIYQENPNDSTVYITIYDLNSATVFYEIFQESASENILIRKLNEFLYVIQGENTLDLFINENLARYEYWNNDEKDYDYFFQVKGNKKLNYYNSCIMCQGCGALRSLVECDDKILVKSSEIFFIVCRENMKILDKIDCKDCIEYKVSNDGKVLAFVTEYYLHVVDLERLITRKISVASRIKNLLFLSDDSKIAFVRTQDYQMIMQINIDN